MARGWASHPSDGLPMSSSVQELEQDIRDTNDRLRAALGRLDAAYATNNNDRITAATRDHAAEAENLAVLNERLNFYMKQQPVSKSFTEADEDWIASVTGIGPKYKTCEL